MTLGNIQSNAVSQFEAWSREENSFRAAAAQADRERSHVEARLRQLRLEQKQLSIDTRESSDALGRFHRERGLLLQEKERLEQQLKEERFMLEECARESETLVTQTTAAKQDFCQEMEALNDELSALLHQREDRRLQKMICSETMAALQEFFAKQNDDASKHDGKAELEAAMEAWIAANISHENAKQECETIKKIIGSLRARTLQQQALNVGFSVRKRVRRAMTRLPFQR